MENLTMRGVLQALQQINGEIGAFINDEAVPGDETVVMVISDQGQAMLLDLIARVAVVSGEALPAPQL